jgi:hypothetical protein
MKIKTRLIRLKLVVIIRNKKFLSFPLCNYDLFSYTEFHRGITELHRGLLTHYCYCYFQVE